MLLDGTMPLHVFGVEGGNPGRGSHQPRPDHTPLLVK